MRWAKALHCFSEEFQCRFAVTALGNIAFQHFSFLVNSPPEVVGFTVNLYEHLVQMPLPIRMSTKLLNPFSSDLRGEQRSKAPFSFRDGDVIAKLLAGAGFAIQARDSIVLERRFEHLFEQIMALPVEKDLSEAGKEATDAVVEDVAAGLEQYAKGNVFIVPQEAHLFEAQV